MSNLHGMNKKVLNSAFISWLPIGVAILALSGLVYCVGQQSYRQSANDPQIQIVEDVIGAIGQGQPADSLVPPQGSTELGKSLSPFLMVFNATGTLIGTSISVDGQNPSFPTQALEVAKMKGQSRITWQPKPGVRAAVIVAPYKSDSEGFIVAGRSLREVEMRIKQLCLTVSLGALASLVLSFIVALLIANKSHKITHTEKITEIEIKSEI